MHSGMARHRLGGVKDSYGPPAFSMPASTRAISEAKALAASACEMWATFSTIG